MIRYTLRCENGHAFEAWFASSTAFERLRDARELSCAVCASVAVDRALMAPAIATQPRSEPQREASTEPPAGAPRADSKGPSDSAPTAPAQKRNEEVAYQSAPTWSAGEAKAMRQMLRELHAAVKARSTDVGRDFPEVARRLHYGEEAPRDIHGQADPDEARALIEEGVEILPLPPLPEERN